MFKLKFKENNVSFKPAFGEIYQVSDGGYERGYEAGYNKGYDEGETTGYDKGHNEGEVEGYKEGYDAGLAARTYETWTITYVDGTVEEKDVALL